MRPRQVGIMRGGSIGRIGTPIPFGAAMLANSRLRPDQKAHRIRRYCPDMVVVGSGKFMMGDKGGQHEVIIAKPFAVSRFAVTFDQWDACVADGGCDNYRPNDFDWGRGTRPVIYMNWCDAIKYVDWLNMMVGAKAYRLLSEAEFEYAARAGSTTKYPWGDDIGKNNANCNGCISKWDNWRTAPVGSFKANAFGLYDMQGNVNQWVEDCWHDYYAGAPNNPQPAPGRLRRICATLPQEPPKWPTYR